MMSGAFLYPPARPMPTALFCLSKPVAACHVRPWHHRHSHRRTGSRLLTPRREGELLLDVPAGQIRIEYQRSGAKVDWVKLYNVAAYLAHADKVIDVPGLGCLKVDVAYGGNFYVIVDPQENFPGLRQWSAADILRWSPLVREAAREQLECVHPDDATVQGISHVLWTGDCLSPESNGANAVFYGDKAIDRSPCGTGTSARMAQLHAKGLLNAGDSYTHESIIGSQFIGRIEGTTASASSRLFCPVFKLGQSHRAQQYPG